MLSLSSNSPNIASSLINGELSRDTNGKDICTNFFLQMASWLLPSFLHDILDEWKNFGFAASYLPYYNTPKYVRSWKPVDAIVEKCFKVNLDVQQFRPDELKVRIVDGYAVIQGKHEERADDHGWVSREFSRRYKIPDNVDMDSLTSELSSDGVLTLQAPSKAVVQSSKEENSPLRKESVSPAVKQADKKQKLEVMDE